MTITLRRTPRSASAKPPSREFGEKSVRVNGQSIPASTVPSVLLDLRPHNGKCHTAEEAKSAAFALAQWELAVLGGPTRLGGDDNSPNVDWVVGGAGMKLPAKALAEWEGDPTRRDEDHAVISLQLHPQLLQVSGFIREHWRTWMGRLELVENRLAALQEAIDDVRSCESGSLLKFLGADVDGADEVRTIRQSADSVSEKLRDLANDWGNATHKLTGVVRPPVDKSRAAVIAFAARPDIQRHFTESAVAPSRNRDGTRASSPSNRSVALLSIMMGQMPFISADKLRQGVSAADVIDMEANSIMSARKSGERATGNKPSRPKGTQP